MVSRWPFRAAGAAERIDFGTAGGGRATSWNTRGALGTVKQIFMHPGAVRSLNPPLACACTFAACAVHAADASLVVPLPLLWLPGVAADLFVILRCVLRWQVLKLTGPLAVGGTSLLRFDGGQQLLRAVPAYAQPCAEISAG